jgi:hypothetical protein
MVAGAAGSSVGCDAGDVGVAAELSATTEAGAVRRRIEIWRIAGQITDSISPEHTTTRWLALLLAAG